VTISSSPKQPEAHGHPLLGLKIQRIGIDAAFEADEQFDHPVGPGQAHAALQDATHLGRPSADRGIDSHQLSCPAPVHDGVRPFVTVDEINSTVQAAKADGAAILVAPVTDTIKEVTDASVLKTLDRGALRRALTPQCFRYELLLEAYQHADVNDPSLTDESALVEQLGRRVSIVEGSARNIKITTVEDLAIAEAILAAD